MIETELEKMKKTCGMNCTEIALAANLPEATVRKVMSGKTSDPRYETIFRIVTAMGYTMNDLTEFDVKNDVSEETQSSIEMIKKFYENRLRELHTNYAGYIKSLKKDKQILAIALAAILLFVFTAIAIDFFFGNIGWIRH